MHQPLLERGDAAGSLRRRWRRTVICLKEKHLRLITLFQ